MRFFRCYDGPLEKRFTVVYWDQRGAGKSFDPNIPKSTMTVEQFIVDLDALVDAMWAEVSALNLLTLAPALQMPVFFFLGRHDRWVPPEFSIVYFDMLTAPFKQLVWFEQSGHEPFVDEPTKFNQAMIELVLPQLKLPAGHPLRADDALDMPGSGDPASVAAVGGIYDDARGVSAIGKPNA